MGLDEISVAIGELRADSKNMVASIQRIEAAIQNLPPSPICLAKHAELDRAISDLKVKNAKHATIIGGATAGIVLFAKHLLAAMGFGVPTP
jgi:K+/H+ antiporter YhaU regulatory subunit KhtT